MVSQLGATVADGQTLAVQGGVLARKLARARGVDFNFGAGLAAASNLDIGAAISGDAPATGAFDGGVSLPAAPDQHIRAWRLALARAARDQLKMTVGFAELSRAQLSLTEVLETPMQRALILMLQGAGDSMGLMVISGQMLAAMIEILTLTHLSHDAPEAGDLRKPTRTDAAMAVEFVDAALAGIEGILAESGALGTSDWAAGYRYAAFIEDPRPLHLILEECDYQLLSAELVLEDGARRGQIWLALPASHPQPALADFPSVDFSADLAPAPAEEDTFSADLAAQLQELPAVLDATLAQISLPIERLLALQLGEVLALPMASLDCIHVTGLDGRRMGRARLGQNRGMRALRLTELSFAAAPSASGAGAGPAQGHGAGGLAILDPASPPPQAATADFDSQNTDMMGAAAAAFDAAVGA